MYYIKNFLSYDEYLLTIQPLQRSLLEVTLPLDNRYLHTCYFKIDLNEDNE